NYDKSLLENILPNQTAPSPLGHTWLYKNGGWSGIWRRIDETTTFDCYDQLSEDGDVVTYKVDIYISGEDVIILRKDSSDNNNPSLRGKLVDNGTKVKDEFGVWEAKIEQRRL
ncbi:hypothetical protein, partial [Stenotrophomonas maltophilia group sp. RNC7]|uniref:hypothetical protein n=1 Tax=Stenotrophomonas maltophilia group sp. RNC7 TaxID=3071467 RepID=UPI0027DEB9BD